MNAKSLAHSIQADLRAFTALDVGRSHVHELIAAAFGCGSHAALMARGVLCSMPLPLLKRVPLEKSPISQRALNLGYPAVAAERIGTKVVAAIDEARLRLLPLDLAVGLLLDGQTALHCGDLAPEPESETLDDSLVDEDDFDDLDEDAWRARLAEADSTVIELDSEEVLAALTSAIEARDARAFLAMALLLEPAFDEFDGQSSHDGSYWYERALQGQVLAGVEKEWADDFANRATAKQTAKRLLEEAADSGQPDALLLMAQRYGDPRFFELSDPQVHADPSAVARLADRLGFHEAAVAWLELAAESGDFNAMRELIMDLQTGDPVKCWTWFHLGLLHGKDLTKDDYHAIHEDGSPYDDDVGGALFAVGEDGVELPEANAAVQEAAKRAAQKIYTR